MVRSLNQRIRESGPVRLLLDNRLVRHFADKPVTKPPTRRQTILIGLIPALTIMAMLVTGWFLIALYPDTFGSPLILLTLPILFFGGLFIGQTRGHVYLHDHRDRPVLRGDHQWLSPGRGRLHPGYPGRRGNRCRG